MIFLWIPETKNLTLEELDQVFSVKTNDFIAYQTGTWLPWFIRRYIRWDRDAYLKPLLEKSHAEKNWGSAADVRDDTYKQGTYKV